MRMARTDAAPPLRLAVVSTPRSGNTWLRMMLARLYDVPELAVHRLAPGDWAGLPTACVLQLHWRRTPEFEAELATHGFRVVVIVRHPLDVLVSVLQFAVHNPEAQEWLAGENGDERPLWGVTPAGPAFAAYAVSPRAASLLAVSREWAARPDAVTVRYEELVAGPAGVLVSVAGRLGVAPVTDPAAAVAECGMGKLRPGNFNSHYWQGRPGLWREVVPAESARAIAVAHAGVFADLGYAADADQDLTPAAAEARWAELAGAKLSQTLLDGRAAREDLVKARREFDSLGHLYRMTSWELDATRAEVERQREELAGAHAAVAIRGEELADLRERLAALEGLGRTPLAAARALKRLRDACPKLAATAGRAARCVLG
jgi:hypothetical protein